MTDNQTSRPKWRNAFDVTATAVMIIAAGFMIVTSVRGGAAATISRPAKKPDAPPPTSPISVKGAMMRGSQAARVAIIEYSDFQCPYCGKFMKETLPALEEKYIKTGQVRLYFIHEPLAIHANAQKAAEADVCAARQGKGWEMHDALFADQAHLDVASLSVHASSLGLERSRFDECFAGQAVDEVKADVAAAKAAKVTGTPAFLVGTIGNDERVTAFKRLTGALPPAAFDDAIQALMAGGVR